MFTQITTKDNQAFLPENYIDNLKKKLTKLEYNVEVLGMRLTKMPKTFYSGLEDRYKEIDEETFYDPYKEVVAVVDFNAHFTSCSVWQDYGKPQHCIMGAFVYEPEPDMDMSQTLATELLRRLEYHQKRTIHITGDRNGLNSSASSKKNNDGTWITMFDEFAQVFEDAGWNVILSPLTYNPFKEEIHTLMRECLARPVTMDYIFASILPKPSVLLLVCSAHPSPMNTVRTRAVRQVRSRTSSMQPT